MASEERPSKRQRVEEPSEPVFPFFLPQESSTDSSTSTVQENEATREKQVGILEFISQTQGFTGILKQRYTDFLVNEILPNGRVLHLENLEAPRRKNIKQEQEAETEVKDDGATGQDAPDAPDETSKDADVDMTSKNESNGAEQAASGGDKVETEKESESNTADHEISEEHRTRIAEVFGEDLVDPVVRLHKAVLQHENWKPSEFRPVKSKPIETREERTKAHQVIRQAFNSRLDTVTVDNNVISITKAAKKADQRGGKFERDGIKVKGKAGWNDYGGQYVHFSLYKENKDTMEAVSFLASQLRVAPKAFAFSGTKDRRAVTVQRLSAFRIHAETLARAGKTLKNSRIGDFKYEQTGLELGELGGNEFVITLRDCSFPTDSPDLSTADRLARATELVSAAASAFATNGFINYYGLQRFGSFTTGTDQVGKKLLQGDVRGAIAHVLEFSPVSLSPPDGTLISQHDQARAQAISQWARTGATRAALELLPRRFSAERNIISHLGHRDRDGRTPRATDYQGAMRTVPRALRLMYVHAYQSLVWNHLASARWRRFGAQVIAGDLVLVHEHRSKELAGSAPAPDLDDAGEPIVRPAPEDSAFEASDFERARALTAQEAASGAYAITDVVLPLPGFDVEYPANEIGEEYVAFMRGEVGGGLDPHDMRRAWRDISMAGGYRKLLTRPGPGRVESSVKVYVREDEQLVQTDMDRLREAGKVPALREGPRVVVGDEVQQEKLAVVLKFSLGAGTYATMALRELMGSGGVRTYQPDFGGGR